MAKACQSGQYGDNLSREAGEDREALRELGIAESRRGCCLHPIQVQGEPFTDPIWARVLMRNSWTHSWSQ